MRLTKLEELQNKIKRAVRRLLLGYDVSSYYFSQGGEDSILQNIFHKKLKDNTPGFYVDIGAFHPYRHSNTFLFYKRGWSGLNIDARPGSMNLFEKKRKRDINIEIAISDESNTLTYYYIDEKSPMNSFSKQNLMKIGMLTKVKKEIEIKTHTLADVFDKYLGKSKHIDFLNIDVEGLGYNVLKSNNWSLYRPDVIIIELDVTEIDDIFQIEAAKYLMNLGYKAIAKNVILKGAASVFFVSSQFNY